MIPLIQNLVSYHAEMAPDAEALRYRQTALSYADLDARMQAIAGTLQQLGIAPDDRVAAYLEKRPETIVALFAAATAGAVFVPVNPVLKPAQVAHILRDCNARVLVTSASRLAELEAELTDLPDLYAVLVTDADGETTAARIPWHEAEAARYRPGGVRRIDTDMAAILYTSGSTGRPKGVVLSHRNLTSGAASVAQYLENRPDDRLLAVLPLSFDYGLSQVTTAFHAGGCAVLMNYLLPRDVIRTVSRERITGLAAVPPLWIQLGELDWPEGTDDHLRYMTSSGGRMPRHVVQSLREKLPRSRFFVMYGLTEAFRSTYLPPEEWPRRPESMGRAIPNAELMVIRPDGSPAAPGEAGELVHRGSLVAMGYWNDPERTRERFRPAPAQPKELPLAETAVWSGDTVTMDEDGYLYFLGREDEMIKTSGYRVSPTEVEEVVYDSGLATEAVALGIPHPVLGEGIVLVAWHSTGVSPESLLETCRERLPAFMVPAAIRVTDAPLPRNPNGKLDRRSLAHTYQSLFQDESS